MPENTNGRAVCPSWHVGCLHNDIWLPLHSCAERRPAFRCHVYMGNEPMSIAESKHSRLHHHQIRVRRSAAATVLVKQRGSVFFWLSCTAFMKSACVICAEENEGPILRLDM